MQVFELEVLPWTIVLLSMIYLILLLQQSHWCWLFGIASSGLSYIVFQPKLFFESLLYLYYVAIGIYAWRDWLKKGVKNNSRVRRLSIRSNAFLLIFQIALVTLIGYLFKSKQDDLKSFVSERPYADAFTSIFSVVATFLEARRYLVSWLYWIVINFFSVWLYLKVQEPVLAGQMAAYGLLSMLGFWRWKKLS